MKPFEIRPIREAEIIDILEWRYARPYDFYDPPSRSNNDKIVQQFLEPSLGFHSLHNQRDELIGFCSFGRDGQVNGGDYSEAALDIGLGMKPEFTGKGLGSNFLQAILDFSDLNFEADTIRLSVASFNQRALCLYEKFGFIKHAHFTEPKSRVDYTVLLRKINKSCA